MKRKKNVDSASHKESDVLWYWDCMIICSTPLKCIQVSTLCFLAHQKVKKSSQSPKTWFRVFLTLKHWEMNIRGFVLAFIRSCHYLEMGMQDGEEWMEASLLNLFSLGPFVRARLSPSPAVKGRIVAPAASLVLMSPDANLTHGWSLNNHFLNPVFSDSPSPYFLMLPCFLFLKVLFILFSFS